MTQEKRIIEITEENYSKKTVKHFTAILPRGWKQEVADVLGITYDIVNNVDAGKQYRKDVVDEIMKRFRAVTKKYTKTTA